MNKQEAARIMAVMAAAFPGTTVTEETAEVWYRAVLHDISYEEGQACVERMLTDPDRSNPHSFPKLSEMQAVRRARRRSLEATAGRELAEEAEGSAPVSKAQAKANIALLRAKLPKAVKAL